MKIYFALFLLAGPGFASAQDQPAPPAGRAEPERPALPKEEPSLISPVGDMETRLKLLHETVTLTDEQRTKVKAILVKNDAAMKAAVAAFRASHTKEDRQKLSALMKAQNVEINALLSEEQKTKGQTAQNTIPSAQRFRPGIPGSGAAALTPGSGAATSSPPISSPPPAVTR